MSSSDSNLSPASDSNDLAGQKSIDRILSILRAIAATEPGGIRLSDVAQRTALSKSTAHRILGALDKVKLVDHDEDTGRFYLGFELYALGSKAAGRYGLLGAAKESLSKLAEQTGDTVYLLVRSGNDVLCITREEGSFPIKTLTMNVGDRRPLGFGAGGTAVLSALDDEEVRAILRANEQKLASAPNHAIPIVWHNIENARQAGHVMDRGRIVPGMTTLSVPIRASNGKPIGALSIAAIDARMQSTRRNMIYRWIRAEISEIERKANRTGERSGA